MQHQFNTTPNILGSLVGGFKDGYNVANTIRQNQQSQQFQLEDREVAKQQLARQNQFQTEDRAAQQQQLLAQQQTAQLGAQQKLLKQQQAGQPSAKDNLASRKFESDEAQQKFENKLLTDQRDNDQLTSIALGAAEIKDPVQMRTYLKSKVTGNSERTNQMVVEASTMPDAEMMATVLDQAKSGQANSDRADQMFMANKLSTKGKRAVEGGLTVGSDEFKAFMLEDQGGIRIDNRRQIETAEEKAFGKAGADQFAEIASEAEGSQNQLALIDSMRNIDVKTGMLEGAKAKLGAFAEALGINQSFVDVGSVEAFEATTTKMVNESLRLNKGVQTEGDAQRARKEMAAIEGSEKGNTFKLNIMESVARRKIEQDQFIRQARVGGMKAEPALGAWRDYINDNPSMSRSLKKNGMPVFFYQFEQFVKGKNPDATRDEILSNWKGQQ